MSHKAVNIKSYRDLEVWQKAIMLVKDIYVITKGFPRDEAYGLTSQVRRSAVSIAANIAEGRGRGSKKEFVRFLFISYGSLCELETHLIVAREIGALSAADMEMLLDKTARIGRMLNGLRKSLLPETRNLAPETQQGFYEESFAFLEEESA